MDRGPDALLAEIRSIRTHLGARAQRAVAQGRTAAAAASSLLSLRGLASSRFPSSASTADAASIGRLPPALLLVFGLLLGLQALLRDGNSETK